MELYILVMIDVVLYGLDWIGWVVFCLIVVKMFVGKLLDNCCRVSFVFG